MGSVHACSKRQVTGMTLANGSGDGLLMSGSRGPDSSYRSVRYGMCGRCRVRRGRMHCTSRRCRNRMCRNDWRNRGRRKTLLSRNRYCQPKNQRNQNL